MVSLEEWLKGRPEIIQKLAAEFPPDIPVYLNGELHQIIGYNEGDALVLYPSTAIDNEPSDSDWDESKIKRICASHLRMPIL